jgi:hypothetical protein
VAFPPSPPSALSAADAFYEVLPGLGDPVAGGVCALGGRRSPDDGLIHWITVPVEY